MDNETSVMLEEAARLDGSSPEATLARAIEEYWGRRLNEASNEAYNALRENPEAWRLHQEEQDEWDVTLTDGLDDELRPRVLLRLPRQ